jgi:hypothetical protein
MTVGIMVEINNVALYIQYDAGIVTEATEAPRVARFSGQSFLAFPALRGAYKDVQVLLEFKPEAPDGVLLLAAERDDMAGDFLALVLVDSYVEFR